MQFLFAQVVLSYLSNRRHLIYVIFLLKNFSIAEYSCLEEQFL